MKRLFGLALLAVSLAGAAHAQDDYPAQALVKRAEAKAKAAAEPCLAELRANRSGPACARYHAAVLDALGAENRRLQWCNPRMSEASNIPVPPSCFAIPPDMRLETVEDLERKVSPKAWKAFDQQMAKYTL